ncbi:Iron only hydrogenase large subunit, partial [human gut metagenome]
VARAGVLGQFGPEGVPERMRKAFQRLGFADVYEVAIGADLCVIEEAADFLEEVPEKHKFMVTSCCPSWSDMVKKLFPQFEKNISVAFTPMVLTARMIKRDHPDCKVVFVGPCDSKKLEARRESVRSDVDFVLTFEEALGIFAAKGMDKAFPPEDEEEMPAYSSRDARRFAYSGGVAQAVVNAIHDMEPDREVKVAAATGLADCRK